MSNDQSKIAKQPPFKLTILLPCLEYFYSIFNIFSGEKASLENIIHDNLNNLNLAHALEMLKLH